MGLVGPRLLYQRCGLESCKIERKVINDLVDDLLWKALHVVRVEPWNCETENSTLQT